MIAVGSGSMTGTIDKGDAIIYERYNGEVLHEGDIIVFKIDNTLIVQGIAGSGKTSVALHRIAFLLYKIKNYFIN